MSREAGPSLRHDAAVQRSSTRPGAESGAVATHLAPASGLPIAEVAGCPLVAELSSGGHAVVYRAWQPLLRRYVAIKALTSEAQADPALLHGFLREARLLARFAHPNLPQVHDLVSAHGGWFLILELCIGLDLLDVLEQQPCLPEAFALAIFSQAARALAHVHAHGVVHGDIKPANLILTRQGLVKLVDFGLSRQAGDPATSPSRTTPAYRSPEQEQGSDGFLDARSDQYALALVLQQMLTGQKSRRLLSSAAGASIPAAVQSLLARCLREVPDERYASMEDVVAACESLTGPAALRREREQVQALVTLLQQPTAHAP
ncbi:MAG: serine/threonine protein kinase [Myxococcales bacterium]|nr:serine/threonine protein kinase [Myxococcales bacterium]